MKKQGNILVDELRKYAVRCTSSGSVTSTSCNCLVINLTLYDGYVNLLFGVYDICCGTIGCTFLIRCSV